MSVLKNLPRNWEFKKSKSIVLTPVNTRLPKDAREARARVLTLYKKWYREIPSMLYIYHIPFPTHVGRTKLREIFVKNSKVNDIGAIHQLVINGQNELNQINERSKETDHVMKYFRSIDQKKPNDFLSKFIENNNQ